MTWNDEEKVYSAQLKLKKTIDDGYSYVFLVADKIQGIRLLRNDFESIIDYREVNDESKGYQHERVLCS